MRSAFDADLVVVGFGSAGMTAAELADGLGLRVVGRRAVSAGGDCLWTGCVPSKALIAAARRGARRALGPARSVCRRTSPEVDLDAVWRRMRAVREEIARGDDDPRRFEALGVTSGEARHEWSARTRSRSPTTSGAVTTVTARIVLLLCTGGRPVVPADPGAGRGRATSPTRRCSSSSTCLDACCSSAVDRSRSSSPRRSARLGIADARCCSEDDRLLPRGRTGARRRARRHAAGRGGRGRAAVSR